MKPIYVPRGKAKEYGDYAINIYTGCNHGCFYCYARKMRERYTPKGSICGFSNPTTRPDIVGEVKRQIERDGLTGKLIHLCFTCDPYPAEIDTTATRQIIKAIKESGNHVQILTKGDGSRDFDLLDDNDWYGITYAGYPMGTMLHHQESEPAALEPVNRLAVLERAHRRGIRTWISFEPVLVASSVLMMLDLNVGYVDKYKIGKLNYYPSNVDWADFGRRAEAICKARGLDYYIKDSLRQEMH